MGQRDILKFFEERPKVRISARDLAKELNYPYPMSSLTRGLRKLYRFGILGRVKATKDSQYRFLYYWTAGSRKNSKA